MARYTIGGNIGETPDRVKRKRELAAKIMGQGPLIAPRSTLDGLGNAFDAIMGGVAARRMNSDADEAERVGQESASGLRDQLIASITGGSFPAAPNPGNSLSMATLPATDTASARVAQAHGDNAVPAQSSRFSGGKQEFIDMLMPAAMEASQRTGVDPRIIVAQAAQETGWGRSAPGNNYFGIKSHGKGGGQNLRTHEYVNGQRVNVNDSFRTFDSPEASVGGYADFMLQNPRYRPLMAAQGLDAQLEALQASGYATDPNYSRSVGQIARGIQMPQMNETAGPAPMSQPAPPISDAAFNDRFSMGGAPAPEMLDGSGMPNAQAYVDERMQGVNRRLPGLDMQTGQGIPQQQPMQQPTQVAQAGGFPEMAGNNPQAIPAPQGPDLQMLLQASQNPWLNEQQRSVVNMLLQQQMEAQDPSHQLDMRYRQAQIDKMQREAAGGNRRYGLNPIYGQDAQGNTVLGVLGDDGSFKPVDTGGVNVSTGVDRVDLGTQWGLLDKRSGQMVGTLPKENYQEAFDTASGTNDAKSATEARSNLPKVEDNATAILGMIESLSTDPYLDSMVGPVSGRLPNVSSDAARVQSKMDQIGGQAFLQAFETLRGGGQISNVEGERATAALARLNTAQSPQDYRQALEELSTIVRTSLSRARRSAGLGSGNNPPPGASGDGWHDMGGVRIRRKQ